MAMLLTLLFCLGGSYWLLQGLHVRAPAASRMLLRVGKWLAPALLAFGLYALLNFADDGDWIFLTSALLALGFWTLPAPMWPTWRERLEKDRPWMIGLLLLALPGVAVLSWIEPRKTTSMTEQERAAAPEAADAAAEESPVFYSLGPRRKTETPRVVRQAAPLPAEPVEEPAIFWRLVDKVTRRETPASPPAATASARKTAPAAGANGRVAAKANPADAAVSKAANVAPPTAPAGVNTPVIDRMLARAETLLQQGKPQEAAAVAANVLAFDPANAAAKRIRQEAGSVARR